MSQLPKHADDFDVTLLRYFHFRSHRNIWFQLVELLFCFIVCLINALLYYQVHLFEIYTFFYIHKKNLLESQFSTTLSFPVHLPAFRMPFSAISYILEKPVIGCVREDGRHSHKMRTFPGGGWASTRGR